MFNLEWGKNTVSAINDALYLVVLCNDRLLFWTQRMNSSLQRFSVLLGGFFEHLRKLSCQSLDIFVAFN